MGFTRSQIEEQFYSRGVSAPEVIRALQKVPREVFVPAGLRHEAYDDTPLSIGEDQTISQPYMVAFMTAAAKISKEHRVLEIGTGCGYQTAILAELAGQVFTVERIESLYLAATQRLHELKYTNIHTILADGFRGLADKAPFDAIIVTAAPPKVPEILLNQLVLDGRMIVPTGKLDQRLERITRTSDGFLREVLMSVRFVPMLEGVQS